MTDANIADPLLPLTRQLVAEGLTAMLGEWVVQDEIVRGNGTLAVLFQPHGTGPHGHVDLGFYFNVGAPQKFILWDCAAGIGATPEEGRRNAVKTWLASTAPVMLELLDQKGKLADHAHGDDGLGMTGWHSIHGPFVGWGKGNGGEILQQWVVEHPLLPQLASLLPQYLRRDMPNGVKFIYAHINNTVTAEVRVNGDVIEPLTQALAALPWPQPEMGFFRSYVMLVHPI